MVPIIYPDSQGKDINDIKIPQDIREYIERLGNVIRFNHFSEKRPGMIDDNSKAHTIRCVYRSMTIPFSHPDLARTLWIHDIPEYTDNVDLSAIERHKNHEKAREQEEAEKAVAKKVLKESDFELFEDFHISEDFLRRSGNELPGNQQTLIANVVDVLDGNLVFVYFFTNWLQTWSSSDEDDLRTTFKYGLEIRERMLKAIQNPKIKPEIKKATHFLFNSYIKVALSLWDQVNKNEIPRGVKSEILKMRTLLS